MIAAETDPGNLKLLDEMFRVAHTIKGNASALEFPELAGFAHVMEDLLEAVRKHAVGVIMTGMGDDGAQGLLEMRTCGAQTIAQDESSCVVFGMPKEAISRGAVVTVTPLVRIAATALKMSGC